MTRLKIGLTLAVLAISTVAFAQKATLSATQTREELRAMLRNYPPQLATVLRLDPTLLTNQTYMATYPDLTQFLTQHPDVIHNPSYFLGGGGDDDSSEGGYRVWREIGGDIAGFSVFLIITGVLIWMIKTLIEQRRWNRLSAIQTEVHSKLLDRFTSNEELLAYLQTPAGKKFLESAPIPLEAGPRPMSAPVGRIFWSLQAGLILIAAGIGFDLVSKRFPAPGSAGLYGVGVIALFVGVALVISAGVFYGLSKRFGLWQADVS
jgi:hypothetical protein